jgi:hypothetical protein
MSLSLHTEGEEYAIQAYAVEIDPGRSYGGVLVVCRMPGGEELYRDASAEYGCCYGNAREAVRHALQRGHHFIRAEQRRCRPLF